MIISVFEFSHNLVITGYTSKDILPYKKKYCECIWGNGDDVYRRPTCTKYIQRLINCIANALYFSIYKLLHVTTTLINR